MTYPIEFHVVIVAVPAVRSAIILVISNPLPVKVTDVPRHQYVIIVEIEAFHACGIETPQTIPHSGVYGPD